LEHQATKLYKGASGKAHTPLTPQGVSGVRDKAFAQSALTPCVLCRHGQSALTPLTPCGVSGVWALPQGGFRH